MNSRCAHCLYDMKDYLQSKWFAEDQWQYKTDIKCPYCGQKNSVEAIIVPHFNVERF